MRQVAIRLLVLAGLATGFAATADTTRGVSLDAAAAERFAALALKCLHDEYPSHLPHTMDSAADARPPHELTPAFYGCYDWHSDVHGHWLLVRLLRLFPDAACALKARSELVLSLTTQAIAGEVAYFRRADRIDARSHVVRDRPRAARIDLGMK